MAYIFSVSQDMWVGGGGQCPNRVLNFKSVFVSRRQYKFLRSEPGVESRSFDSGFLQRFMKNRHIRVRNGGGMITDNKIARY